MGNKTAAAIQASKNRWRYVLMGGPLCILLLALLVYPVGQLLLQSFYGEDGGFGIEQYRRLFQSTVYVDVLLITLRISLWTTFFAVVAGFPVAYLISSLPRQRKGSLLFWVVLSFWTSFLVRTFAWVVILGRNGPLNQLLLAMGVIDAPADLMYQFGSVIVGMVHALMPLAVLTMLSVMENIDRNLPKAAATLGAKPGTAFWKIYFPLSLPGVAAAGIMVFVTAIGFFITPALLGGRRETMITQIIIDQIFQTLNWGFAGAISVLLLIVVLLVFGVYDKLLGLSSMAGGSVDRSGANNKGGVVYRVGEAILNVLATVSDWLLQVLPKRKRRRASDPGQSRTMWAVVIMVLIFLSLPAFLMFPLSFNAESGLNWPPRGFSLQWYEQMFASPVWMRAIVRSLIVGVGAGVLAMLIGTPVAFMLVRSQIRGKGFWLAFVLSPIVVPRMIIAVGMFYFFAKVGLVGTAIGLILGHTVIAVPYVVITMMAVLRNYDTRLDFAAQSLGATPWATLRFVTFPILGAGLLSSFLFAFATSFDELTIALFSSGGISATLPKQFWDEVTLQISPVIAAVSTCLFVFIAALIWFADRLRNRSLA